MQGSPEDPAATPAPSPSTIPVDPEVQDRELVFLSQLSDSAVVVPWLFRTRTLNGESLRERGLWLGRGGGWEALLRDTIQTPGTDAPWRIVPGGPVRLVVGREDTVERLLFREGPRELEVAPGEFLAEWGTPEGSTFRLHRGTATFPSGSMDGFVLDLLRTWSEEGTPPGDWVFLHAGDRAQLILEERTPVPSPRSPAAFRGWSRVAFQQQPWPEVEVSWEEARAFEPARRDIPVDWRLASPGGEVEGEFQAVGFHLAAGSGEGPILPVLAFYEVEGEIRIMGEAFPVQGLVRHLQW